MENKKEHPKHQEPRLIISITLTRGLLALLALAVATVAFLGYLAWGQQKATAASSAPVALAAPPAFAPMHKYYLTQSKFDGDEVLTACAPGYHVAALWEILDTSKLQYNTKLGATQADSGAGPPTDEYWVGVAFTCEGEMAGWVRTGWDSESDAGIIGQDNCALWTSDEDSDRGTLVALSERWEPACRDMHVWRGFYAACHYTQRVWCVED
jgi:hypothetical protein